MTWYSYHLRAADEATAKAALPEYVDDASGGWRLSGTDFAVDPIGRVIETPAEIGDDYTVITPATYKQGWYLNVKLRQRRDFPAAITVLSGAEGRDFA